MRTIIGIDIGGTSIKASAVSPNGRLLCVHTAETPKQEELVCVLESLVRLCKADAVEAGASAAAIGMGSPGIISTDGKVLFSNNLRMRNFDLRAEVEKKFQLPTSLLNDAFCATLAEFRFGAGRGVKNMAMVTIGTGIGFGAVINGELFTGTNSCMAGGHIITHAGGLDCTCGSKGCWEMYASASALIRIAKGYAQKYPESALNAKEITGLAVADCVRAGDRAASEAMQEYIANLGDGMVSACNILRPERMVVGGGLSGAGELFIEPLREYVLNKMFIGADYAPLDIVCAQMGNAAGIIGAAAYASRMIE